MQSRFKDLSEHSAPQTYPVVETEDGPKTYAFECLWPVQNDIALHLNCYRMGLTKEQGGWGQFRHLMEAHNIIWPHYAQTLNPWMARRYKTFCKDYQIVTLAGGAGSAKSADVARYALLWWWANPAERTVLVCSTTISMLNKRIWSYITHDLYMAHGGMPGHVSNSPPPKILFDKNDGKHGIHGVPLKEGGKDRTLADLIGVHPTDALLAIVDEATDVTPAFMDAVENWDSGGVNFQMVVIGNPKSRLDPHGLLSKPKRGWNSVHPDDDEEWITDRGICLYFDCYRSPGLDPDYKKLCPFLINEGKIKKKEQQLGKDSPNFWRFIRGFWPPEDLTKTVLTLTEVEKHGASSEAKWMGTWQVYLAALDPAFTSEGDECILRLGVLGMMENGMVGLDFLGDDGIISLHLNARSSEPISYQIFQQAKKYCDKWGVEPHFFGADTWGFGTGVGDVLEREWSPEINRVLGIGKPSDRFVDADSGEKADEVYYNAITEYWFAMRTFVASGQIRGLDEASIEEFCSREYSWKGRKIIIEDKKTYKARMGREDSPLGSPDRADAAAILLEVARRNGFLPDSREITFDERAHWEKDWETQKGYNNGNTQENREEAWSADPILDSAAWNVADEDIFSER